MRTAEYRHLWDFKIWSISGLDYNTAMNASILIQLRPSWLAASSSLRPCRIPNKSSSVAFTRISILADGPWRLPHRLRHYNRRVWVSHRGVVTACWPNQPVVVVISTGNMQQQQRQSLPLLRHQPV
jgi:hypothetical protein